MLHAYSFPYYREWFLFSEKRTVPENFPPHARSAYNEAEKYIHRNNIAGGFIRVVHRTGLCAGGGQGAVYLIPHRGKQATGIISRKKWPFPFDWTREALANMMPVKRGWRERDDSRGVFVPSDPINLFLQASN